ncbi:MAG: hypothetical protein KDI19_12840, partial [Pseudomonadales bacterium]|nr:hypothetical protein [Pseudomonadales bacterium]
MDIFVFRANHLVLLSIVLIIVGATIGDMWLDVRGGASWRHIGQEMLILAASAAGIAYLIHHLGRQRRELAQVEADLAASKAQATGNPALLDARHQMGKAIQAQFEAWELTASEREVALL